MINRLMVALCCATALATVSVPASPARAELSSSLTFLGKADDAREVHFDVILPLRNTDKLEALLADLQDRSSPQYHKWLTPAEFGKRFGPDAATVERVAASLRSSGFTVKKQTRSLRVTGRADQVAHTFGAHLMIAQSEPGTSHVVTKETLHMPADLAAAGAQIFSFIPHVMRTHSRRVTEALPENRDSPIGGYWFDDLKQAYSYPSATATVTTAAGTLPLNGTGATIAALMSSDVLDSDIKAMFDHENWSTITGTPDPTIFHYYVNGGAPFGNGASDEASLDTQQEITGAPGANVVLVDIPDLSDGSIFAGYVDVIEGNHIDLISSSFGECELFYFPQYNGGVDQRGILQAEHELYEQGNAQGISFLASSGDNAGKECITLPYLFGGTGKFVPGISTPAADPNVTAVGGTNLVTAYLQGSLDSSYVGENAWADPLIGYDPYGTGGTAAGGWWGAGGGTSGMWLQPTYQKLVNTGSKRRTNPDVGMQVGGCPFGISKATKKPPYCFGGNLSYNGAGNSQRSYVAVAIGVGYPNGGFYGLIGTSVSSPEFAGAVAHLIELNGRMGNLNPYIYQAAASQASGGPVSFHTGIPGYNGVKATDLNSTYSLSTGVGTPIVSTFIGQTTGGQAGLPQTPSNP